MPKEELLRAMRQQARQELDALHAEADERHTALRGEYAARLRLAREQIRGRHLRGLQETIQSEEHVSRLELQGKLTEHRWQLAQKYRPLSLQVMRELWSEQREQLLPLILAELPDLRWDKIHVAPPDLTLARKLVPQANIQADEALDGGLVANCSERSLTCDLSLSTWMDRLWPNLLTQLLERIGDDSDLYDN